MSIAGQSVDPTQLKKFITFINSGAFSKLAGSRLGSNLIQSKMQSAVEYTVHVHVIEARDLKPTNSNDFLDPVCIIKFGSKKLSTRKFKGHVLVFSCLLSLITDPLIILIIF